MSETGNMNSKPNGAPDFDPQRLSDEELDAPQPMAPHLLRVR